MNRIDEIFAGLRQQGHKALMPFVTAGDPDLKALPELLLAMQNAGASVVEVGIPFSDPVADGPVIQASMTRALDQGTTIQGVFDAVESVREKLTIGLVAMVSYSIVYRIGLDRFVEQAIAAGFDGFIFPDVPVDEAEQAQQVVAKNGGILSQLIAPTTPIERAKTIAANSTGFVYVVSRAGITGEQKTLPPELPDRLRALRDVTDTPLAVGFGVSSAEQVSQVVQVADAAIVGSAIVRQIETVTGQDDWLKQTQGFVQQLAEGLTLKQTTA